ncbi:MAG: hypothetical protein IEMM0002_0747 [bacterium]|nr:MAG: hypothetical protein IEMM0002_0747 [bacterium]
MNLSQLKRELRKLEGKGFIPSKRKGSTGVGYTFECELGFKENNIPIPDAGGRVEFKASRKDSSSAITLFTFDRRVWKNYRELVSKYGYYDKVKSRPSLYSSVKFGNPNSIGLFLTLDHSGNYFIIKHTDGNEIGTWKISHIVSRLLSKLPILLFVLAERRKTKSGLEEFHYNKALLCSHPSDDNFLDAFKNGKAFIDIRMHLKSNGTTRNHGTAFRISESSMYEFYEEIKKLL